MDDKTFVRENYKLLQAMGFDEIKRSTGKNNVSMADAANTFMRKTCQEDALPILLVCSGMLATYGSDLDAKIQLGLSAQFLASMVARFNDLP